MFSEFTSFVRSIYGEGFIPLHEPRFLGNEKKYLLDTIDSTFVSSVGEYVNRFEREFAEFTGSKFAIAVMNGTAGLHLALHTSGVSVDDEVITQPLTFVATCNAISYCGAYPVFVDVDEDTLGMSPDSLQEFLDKYCRFKDGFVFNEKTGRRISAVVPMHTFGHPSRIEEIKKICIDNGLKLIEDCAESLGSSYRNTHTGNFGDISVYSFNGNKVITTGGGGMLVTNDEAIAKKLKYLSTTAKIPHKWKFNHDALAFNYRMPNLNAALGCAQLEKLGGFLEKKKEVAEKYRNFIADQNYEYIDFPLEGIPNFWLNAIRFKNIKERDDFLEFTNSEGVMTRPIWTLMYKLPMYSLSFKSDCPVAEKLESTVVNIPSSVPKVI